MIPALADIVADALAPPPRLLVSQWGEAHRRLTTAESATPGRLSFDLVPFLREPIDKLSSHDPCESVTLMKAAQIGGTEGADTFVGYAIDLAPSPIMVVQPSDGAARKWSKMRLSKLIENTPALAARVRETRRTKGAESASLLDFPGGVLATASAMSAKQLRQMPVRYLVLDDLDGYPADADGEGDPVELAEARTTTYRYLRKIFKISTPTEYLSSRIAVAYGESDQRHYFVPCPHCGTWQVLVWSGVAWTILDRPAREAAYICGAGAGAFRGKWPDAQIEGVDGNPCGNPIEEHTRGAMVAAGQWRATVPERGRQPGYHLPALLSPFVSLGELAARFVRVKRDPTRLQVFVNTALAETWNSAGTGRLDAGPLVGRCEREGCVRCREQSDEAMHPNVAILTAGIDIQDERIELEVVGWGRDEESWSIDYLVLQGDTTVPYNRGVWADLAHALGTRYAHPKRSKGLPIAAACVDTGGHSTQSAYRFCKSKNGRRVFAIKGRGGEGVALWRNRPSSNNKAKVNLYTVGVDAAKETVYARLTITHPGPGFCHFPAHYDAEYFAQLTSETRRVKYKNGRPVRYFWKPDGVRNEALDCRVYALCALHAWYARGRTIKGALDALDGKRDHRRAPVPVAAGAHDPAIPSQDWLGDTGTDWLS